MTEKKLRKLIALTIIAGALMRLFDIEYANIVLVSGLGAFLLVKLIKLLAKNFRTWTSLHVVQLLLIIVAMVALWLRFKEYPYSTVAFGIALLTESLVAAKIFLNEKFGSSTVNSFLLMLKRFMLNSRIDARQ
jgi:uncharacterized membrane protein YhhN